MKLHENTTLFNEAIRATAQRMEILEIYIEKDYWVCYALHLIYSSDKKKEVIFKGGTALSKCYQLIERFSEDIDLVILRTDAEGSNRLKNKLKQITNLMTDPLVEEPLEGITNKMGMIRKIAYNYPKTFKGAYGQVRDRIIIEVTWLGYFEPYTSKKVVSYIYDMMVESNQEKLAQEYNLLPFNVLVLDPKRTICEKIMSLVRFSYTENPIMDLKNKVRHIYDIHQLLQEEELALFFASDAFETMLLKVANDDVIGYKNTNEWLKFHPKEALIFKNPSATWNELKNTYQNNFKDLVYGELPNENTVLKSLENVANRLHKITWNLTF